MWGIQKPAASASLRPVGVGWVEPAMAKHSSANDPWPSVKLVTVMTVWPSSRPSTPSPTAVTTPHASCPHVNGSGGVSG